MEETVGMIFKEENILSQSADIRQMKYWKNEVLMSFLTFWQMLVV